MKRIFLDTNVIIDFILEREGAEDAANILQLAEDEYQCAKANFCDIIITRNRKHFAFAQLPILTPSEYLKNL